VNSQNYGIDGDGYFRKSAQTDGNSIAATHSEFPEARGNSIAGENIDIG